MKKLWTKMNVLMRIILTGFPITILVAVYIVGCGTNQNDIKPNIVFILADDMGTEVLGSYGGKTYQTPNIDELANTGIKFNHCYSAPLCSPSRVKLLTGRYGFRTGQNWGEIPIDEITFGHVLSDAGYKTALAGKWQMILLKEDPNHIEKMGFKENSVFGWHEGPRYYEPMIYQNGKIRQDVQDKYGPDVYCDFLLNFIERNKNNKFLAYYPMTLAHDISDDLEIPPPFGSKGRYETYKENIEYMDKLVGRIINKLDELNLREKTLIIFVGDNGTPHHYIDRYEDGEYKRVPVYSAIGDSLVMGGKSFMTDAGTHVPLLLNWKSVTKPGSLNNDLIDFSDFMPTFAELSGGKLPLDRIIDGRSFAPQIFGKVGKPREWIYQQWEGKAWIRNQKWKLYKDGSLYDMESDPTEKKPIISGNDKEETTKIRMYLKNEMEKLIGSNKKENEN